MVFEVIADSKYRLPSGWSEMPNFDMAWPPDFERSMPIMLQYDLLHTARVKEHETTCMSCRYGYEYAHVLCSTVERKALFVETLLCFIIGCTDAVVCMPNPSSLLL